MSLRSNPGQYQHFNVTFPHERVVQVTLNRPEKLNSITQATSREIQKIWELFDQDESLWVGIITGSGRAFCTGADLQGEVPSIAIRVLSITVANLRQYRMECDEQVRGCQQNDCTRSRWTASKKWQEANYRSREWHMHGGRF
jgi:enoyl-CoA hydratase/carnithine racemase